MKTLLLVIVVALLCAPIAPAAFAADPAKEAVKAFGETMKTADEAGKIKAIQELAAAGHKGAAKAISKFTSNRSTAVAVAAIRALGTLKDKKSIGKLTGMVKPSKDKPKVLEAIAFAIGEIGAVQGIDPLVDLAKKWMSSEKEGAQAIAAEAARGLGKIPHKSCIEELIKLLALTNPKQGQGAQISQATRDRLKQVKPGIIEGLQTLTGWDFGGANAWNRFWDSEQKRWKPGQKEIDLTKLKKYRDPGYVFEVELPGKGWLFVKTTGVRIQLSLRNEKLQIAAINISAYDFDDYAASTPKQKAQAEEDRVRGNWKDTKDESWVRDESYKLAGERGVMYSWTGRDSNGNIMKSKKIWIGRNNVMYTIGTWIRSGQSEKVAEDIEKAISKFRFTD